MKPHRFAYASRRYHQYVEWVALNDNDGNGDNLDEIADYVTTVMLAHVNGVPCKRVAQDIAHIRRSEGRVVGPDTPRHLRD